jgi:hypothetical protein
MDDTIFPLVADVLRRKLPEAKIAPGEHHLAGTALVDLDVTIAKSPPTEAQPTLPWKSIVAALAGSYGNEAGQVIARAARKAIQADGFIPMPEKVEAKLAKVLAELSPKAREGPTKIAGDVELIGFAPTTLVLPGWREVREAIAFASGRRSAAA